MIHPDQPAFPTDAYYDEKRHGVNEGMDARAYFAAHAPKAPQPWFLPVMAAPRPAAQFDHDHEKCGSEGSARMPWECLATNKAEQTAWDVEYHRQRCVQWPWAWADAVIAAGGAK